MQKFAGVLFALAGFIIIMGITLAEIFYPDYNVSYNFISTLGSTPPPTDIVVQPSASIFDLSLMISGVLIMLGAVFLHQAARDKILIGGLFILGFATLCIGVFPAFHAILHPCVAALAFITGGITALICARTATSPFKYLSIALGVLSLGALLIVKLNPSMMVSELGVGGAERLIVYPLLIWLILYGGYLLGGAPRRG